MEARNGVSNVESSLSPCLSPTLNVECCHVVESLKNNLRSLTSPGFLPVHYLPLQSCAPSSSDVSVSQLLLLLHQELNILLAMTVIMKVIVMVMMIIVSTVIMVMMVKVMKE